MGYDEIKHTARLKADELHNEWLADRIGSKLSDGDLNRELFNDEIGESELKEQVGLGRLNENQLLNAYTDLLFIALKKRSHAELRNTDNLLKSTDALSTPSTTKTNSKVSISENLQAFINDKKSENRTIREETLKEYELSINELIDVLGDIHISTIDYNSAKSYRDTMLKVPTHRKKGKYANVSIPSLVKLNIPEEQCLSAKTVKGRLANLSTYFEWLKKHKIIDSNPFEGVHLKAESNSYTPYTNEDLSLIFKSDLYQDSKYARNWGTQSHWWLLLLATYSGARLSELAQIRIQDVKEIDDTLSITVTNEGEEMRVKTKAGLRTFPVHPQLLKLGFSEYLSQQQRLGHTKLLPLLPKGLRKPGDKTSSWYNERYRSKFLPDSFKSQKKVFHSFRHTFISTAYRADVDLLKLQQMVGHEKSLMGESATYAEQGFSQKQLLEELNKVQFDGLDLSHLVNSWRKLKSS